jgi:subtilisin family serine protease
MENHHILRLEIGLLILAIFCLSTASMQAAGPEQEARPGELLVQFADQVPAEVLAAEARRWGAAGQEPEQVRHSLLASAGVSEIGRLEALHVARIKVPAGRRLGDAQSAILASPLVKNCEPNYLRHAFTPLAGGPNDFYYQNNSEWWIQFVEADRVVAENVLPSGSPIIIAIVDSGIMLAHEDLAAQLVAGYSGLTYTASAEDDFGHGTHVAGIAAAATNNGIGIAGTAGTANIKLMPIKVLDGSGSGDDYTIMQGMNWAVDHGARVLNLSLGGPEGAAVFPTAIRYAREHGCVVVAAAGNNAEGDQFGNPPYNPVFYPAAYAGVIAVAACTPSGARASYSEYGRYIDLTAPGGDMGGSATAILSTWPGSGAGLYQYEIGTSMAAPIVAGAAALLLSQDPARTPEQVENLLTTTALKTGVETYTDGWNAYSGWGCVDVYRALTRNGTFTPKAGGRQSYNYPNPFAPSQGEVTSIVIPLAAGQAPAAATVKIFDAMGRLVRTLAADAGQVSAGSTLLWDGRNDRGQPVANGIYPYRLELNGTTYANKIAVKN